jgi:two-component system sensor histidine kinase ChvG
MNLRRQLLLVSLLTLILPWSGCQFIRETESALREGQQQMLGGTAQAIADSLSQFPDELLAGGDIPGEIYAHPLAVAPLIDGYVDDWSVPDGAAVSMRGADGPVRYLVGQNRQHWFLFVEVRDDNVVYADESNPGMNEDAVTLVNLSFGGDLTRLRFVAGAPGDIVARRQSAGQWIDETRIAAYWRDRPTGYRVEARIPRALLGPRLGISVTNTEDPMRTGVTSASYEGTTPGRLVTISPVLQSVAMGYVQPGWRLTVLDREGWRVAETGSVSLTAEDRGGAPGSSGWLRLLYRFLLNPGNETTLAEPSPTGRETQGYIREALSGEASPRWFRSMETDRAVIAVAQPVWSGSVQTGAIVLQQGTDAILSQTNEALARLVQFTMIATVIVAIVLLGYASWLSYRIRQLSEAAERALEERRLQRALPSALASDEVGDLSRSFSSVLRQLGIYNEYLQSLASKLSHELRTPLTIVRSSLENLEHESLPDTAHEYTERAREGTDRLQRILNAMSEASRTEQLIENVEPESFSPGAILESTVRAYADAWPERRFSFEDRSEAAEVNGSPELFIQMIDKLVDNAVEFTKPGDTIGVDVGKHDDDIVISVENPGPPLPDKMRGELFDSMVSVREGEPGKHLGLGLFIARLIAEGHDGAIEADNIDGGVRFTITLPAS